MVATPSPPPTTTEYYAQYEYETEDHTEVGPTQNQVYGTTNGFGNDSGHKLSYQFVDNSSSSSSSNFHRKSETGVTDESSEKKENRKRKRKLRKHRHRANGASEMAVCAVSLVCSLVLHAVML